MSPTDSQMAQLYRDDQDRQYQYAQLKQQADDQRDRQMRVIKQTSQPSAPLGKTLGKFGAPRRRAQTLSPEQIAVILASQQAEQSQMPEAPAEPRFTSDTLNFPSMYLQEEVNRIRTKARNGGTTGGSGHNIYSAATELFGTGRTATGERKRSAVEELFGDRWGGLR